MCVFGLIESSSAGWIDTVTRGASRDYTQTDIDNALRKINRAPVYDAISGVLADSAEIISLECKRFVFDSKAIRAAEFCRLRGGSYLNVEFVNSKTYRYFEISSAVYDKFINSVSAGRFFNSYIRNRYRCERISQSPRVRKSQVCD